MTDRDELNRLADEIAEHGLNGRDDFSLMHKKMIVDALRAAASAVQTTAPAQASPSAPFPEPLPERVQYHLGKLHDGYKCFVWWNTLHREFEFIARLAAECERNKEK